MARIIDLTLTLRDGMRGVEFETTSVLARDGWNARTLKLYSHAGTHMDAPRHFIDDGATLDAMPLEPCVGPARVIDVTGVGPGEVITPDHLGAAAETIGPGDRLLLKTGWSARAGRPEYRDRLPRIGIELARWLADRRVALIGVEPPSVADVNDLDEVTQVHRTLLAAGIVIVEGLTNLDALTREQVVFIALPLKIEGGDGTPVRAVAIEEGGEDPA